MAQIYLIQNNTNNKMYVGFTQTTVEERFKRHVVDSKRSTTPFHRAIRKYGCGAFTLSVLEECEDGMFLHRERESFWISQYPRNKLYNCQPGGEGNRGHGSSVYLYTNDVLVQKFDGPSACAAFMGVPFYKITHALDRQRKGTASGIRMGDQYFVVTRDPLVVKKHVRFDNRKEIQTSDGRIFVSAFEAASALGVSSQRIRQATKKNQMVGDVQLKYKV